MFLNELYVLYYVYFMFYSHVTCYVSLNVNRLMSTCYNMFFFKYIASDNKYVFYYTPKYE